MAVPRPPRRFRAAPAVVLLLLGLSGPGGADGPLAGAGKIPFDLSRLDTAGLYGPAHGRRTLHYEF